MHHIHRQIVGLKNFAPWVIAQKREGEWPVSRLEIVPRSPWRFVARAGENLSGRPWQIGPREVRRIRARIGESRAVVFHVFFGNVAVHLLPLLRGMDTPLVISFHGSDTTGAMAGPGYAAARNEMFQLADLVLCRSEQLAGRVAALGCAREKLRIMRSVLPSVEFIPRSAPPDGAWRIVQASRLVGKKGLATSLRAFAVFLRQHPNALFSIAGEGPLEDDLRGLAGELGVAGRVEFTGFLSQEKLSGLFLRSHIFLHPSETVGGDVEGVPNAMLEAMAGGLPIVSTRHGGIPEVVSDGHTGLLCEEKDISAIAAALLLLAADPARYEKLARAGSDSVRQQFSATRQIANIETLYREAAGGE